MPGTELKAGARKIMKENAPKLFIISIIFIAITTVMSELQFRLPGMSMAYDRMLDRLLAWDPPDLNTLYSYFRPSGAVLAGILWFLLPVISAGYMSYCMKMTRDQSGNYKDILNGFTIFLKAILITIVMSIFIFLWSMLLIVPGIVASYRYRQALYILLDDPDKGIMQCIRESKRLMRGNKLDLFLLDLSFLGWFILSSIVTILLPVPFSLPIISIWLTPYMSLTRASYYDRLLTMLVL